MHILQTRSAFDSTEKRHIIIKGMILTISYTRIFSLFLYFRQQCMFDNVKFYRYTRTEKKEVFRKH